MLIWSKILGLGRFLIETYISQVSNIKNLPSYSGQSCWPSLVPTRHSLTFVTFCWLH